MFNFHIEVGGGEVQSSVTPNSSKPSLYSYILIKKISRSVFRITKTHIPLRGGGGLSSQNYAFSPENVLLLSDTVDF